MRATDADGASSDVVRTFGVGTRPPQAAFSVADGILTSTATDPDGDAIASVAWDLDGDRQFDDATGSSVRALGGTHLVGMAATDAGGDIGITYASVTAPDLPAPAATPTPTPAVQPTPSPAPKPRALALTLGRVASIKRSATSLRLKLGCTTTCRATVTLKLGSHVLARATSKGGTVTLKLSAKARRLLRASHARTLRLTVAAAGTKTLSRTLRLRR